MTSSCSPAQPARSHRLSRTQTPGTNTALLHHAHTFQLRLRPGRDRARYFQTVASVTVLFRNADGVTAVKTEDLLKTIALNTGPFILIISRMFYFLVPPDFLSCMRCIVLACCSMFRPPTTTEMVRVLWVGDRSPPPCRSGSHSQWTLTRGFVTYSFCDQSHAPQFRA